MSVSQRPLPQPSGSFAASSPSAYDLFHRGHKPVRRTLPQAEATEELGAHRFGGHADEDLPPPVPPKPEKSHERPRAPVLPHMDFHEHTTSPNRETASPSFKIPRKRPLLPFPAMDTSPTTTPTSSPHRPLPSVRHGARPLPVPGASHVPMSMGWAAGPPDSPSRPWSMYSFPPAPAQVQAQEQVPVAPWPSTPPPAHHLPLSQPPPLPPRSVPPKLPSLERVDSPPPSLPVDSPRRAMPVATAATPAGTTLSACSQPPASEATGSLKLTPSTSTPSGSATSACSAIKPSASAPSSSSTLSTAPPQHGEHDISRTHPSLPEHTSDVVPANAAASSASSAKPPIPLIMLDGHVMTDDMMDPSSPDVSHNVATSDEMPAPQHASSSSAADRETTHGPYISEGIHSMCHRCGRWIGGYMVHAMGHAWHARCFTCAHCQTPLEHVSFYEHDGEPYCHLDFHELFSRRCYHCQTPIVDERFVTVDAFGDVRSYHEAHFFCAQCGDPFVEQKDSDESTTSECSRPFFVHGRHAYCESCHRPRCQACKKPVGDEHVQALRAVWHPECFVCTRCRKPCQGATFVAPDGSPCDFDCYQAWVRGGRGGPAPPAFLA